MTEQDAIDMVESQERMADALERIAAALEAPAQEVTGPDVPLQPLWIYGPEPDDESEQRTRTGKLVTENMRLKRRVSELEAVLRKIANPSDPLTACNIARRWLEAHP